MNKEGTILHLLHVAETGKCTSYRCDREFCELKSNSPNHLGNYCKLLKVKDFIFCNSDENYDILIGKSAGYILRHFYPLEEIKPYIIEYLRKLKDENS